MANAQAMLKMALRESGCVSFLEDDAAEALDGIERARPEAFALLAQDARESLRDDYLSRMEMAFQSALLSEMKPYIAKRNPLESVLGRIRPESIKAAGEELLGEHGTELGSWLRSRYPLLPSYEESLRNNFDTSYLIFFDALIELRCQIVERLLDGRPFTSITHLTVDGDPHRHGRMVMGIETDAGAFYYKPHDCAVDALYHEIVTRWFSDCTTAATVVQGNGVAFVSRLEAKPLESSRDLDTYFMHFGALTALLHALQSCDAHMENIFACGDKPALVDVETLIAPSLLPQAAPGVEDFGRSMPQYSVLNLGLLPIRSYRMTLFSPLYYKGSDGACLPNYDGQRFTVEGHEESFVEGFREGYSRVLDAREEISDLIRRNEDATIRCLLRNSSFYAIIRQMLYEPNALQDEKAQREVLGRLESPFKSMGVEPNWKEVRYEADSLLQGDIPYFCTTIGSTRLCGEDPGEPVEEAYYTKSAAEKVLGHLDTLCLDELHYEEDLIRSVLSRAPIDAPDNTDATSPATRPLSQEDARALTLEIVRDLQTHAVRLLDGTYTWIRLLDPIYGLITMGSLATLAEVCTFYISLPSDFDEHERAKARSFAGAAAQRLASDFERTISLYTHSEKQKARLPLGLVTGLGGILACCALMERAEVEEIAETASHVLEFLLTSEMAWLEKTGIAQGVVGLALAAALLPATHAGREECLRRASRLVLEQPVPDAPDEAAASAAALAAAGTILGSDKLITRSLEYFRDVRAAYDDELGGWRDSEEKVRWLANRGPHAAGIALAAGLAMDAIDDCKASEEIRALHDLALASLRTEELWPLDSLARGNALSALALLRAGDTKTAGVILEGMRMRRKHVGAFTLTPKGIRSFFEPSLFMGTLGIGWVLCAYQDKLREETAS